MGQHAFIEKEITAGAPTPTWGDFKASANVSHYYLFSDLNGITLTNDWEIAATDVPVEGQTIIMYYDGVVTLNSHKIIINGYELTQAQALRKLKIVCRWESNAWEIFVFESSDQFNLGQPGVETHIIPSAGNTIAIDRNINESFIVLTHEVAGQAQVGNYEVIPTLATPFLDGDEFWISYEAEITANGSTITIFGISLSDAEIGAASTLILAKYDAEFTKWHVYKFGGATSGFSGALVDDTTIAYNTNSQLYDKLWEAGTGDSSVKLRDSQATSSGNKSLAIGYRTKSSGVSSFTGGYSKNLDKIVASAVASLAFGYSSGNGKIESAASGSFAGGTTGVYNLSVNSFGSFAWLIAGARNSGILDTLSPGSFITGYSGVITNSLYASILGGSMNTINSGGTSAIVGGMNNTVNHASSVILGGNNITTRADNTAYAKYLDFADIDSIYAESIRDTNAYNLLVPVAPRAHFLLDEVAILATKLDDWAEPDDNTDLDASITRHGLLPKLPNDATKYMDGTGLWSVPSGAGAGETNDGQNVGIGAGVYKDKSGVHLRFRSITGSGIIVISENTNDVEVAGPDFGNTIGDVPEIGTNFAADAVVITDANKKLKTETRKTAFNRDFSASGGNNGVLNTVAREDHTHTGIDPNAHATTHEAGNSDPINGDALEVNTPAPTLNPGNTVLSSYITAIEEFASKFRSGSVAITVAGSPSLITYSSPFADTDYALTVRAYVVATGVPVAVNVIKVTSGFTVTPAVDCRIDYIAISYT